MQKNRTIRVGMAVVMVVVLFFVGYLSQTITKAAEPKVMVTDYGIPGDSVESGKAFKLTLNIKNTASRKIQNMKISVISESGELLPASGAGTDYVSVLSAEEEREFTFQMKAAAGLEEKAYKLTVRMEYEDAYGSSYTVEDVIYVPVSQVQRLSVTDIMTDESVKVGDEAEVTAMINNLGEAMLYNVTIRVEGEHIMTQSSYIGNVESGKSGTVDVITKTVKATDETEVLDRDFLYITYEDKQGNKYEEKQAVHFFIQPTSYDDLEVLKTAEEHRGIDRSTVIIIVVAVAVALIIVFVILKWRKKKKLLEEF
ncbi:MAG: COG1361 S-layer family protein [Wujia sp.]